MPRPEKVAVVEELKEKLATGRGVILADYRGLNVAEVTELRAQLREAGVEYKVIKNTLARRAADEVGVDGLREFLVGPTAIAIGYDDPVAPAKILNDFAKSHDSLEIKGGMLAGKIIDLDGVKALADLPSREELLAQVLRGMQGPVYCVVNVLQGVIRNFVYALEAVRKKKEQGA